ncbi:hypothetical protein FJY63_15365, partial [Candidatus Sumerlaeota bacterium]|nr:hypothetical protein [Candidatus Sumerlaeota bacterium]
SKTASIGSLKALRRGWPSSRLISTGGFNRFLYCSDGDVNKVTATENAQIRRVLADSPDGAALEIAPRAPGCRWLTQTIQLHDELPWIDIRNSLNRADIRQPEGVYFDFPFQPMKGAKTRFDTAWASVRLEEDLLPGACKNFFCVQRWVEISDKRQTVVLAPMDAPMIEVGEIHPNTRQRVLPEVDRLRLDSPRILSFVMNNYWFTNYRASQPGIASFSYKLYRYDGPSDPVKTARFGISARAPLRSTIVPANNKGPLHGESRSFASVSPDNVIVTTIAPSERGGTLIRLHEIAGKRVRAALRAPVFGNRAELVDLWERSLGRLEMREGRVSLDLAPREIATVRLYRE